MGIYKGETEIVSPYDGVTPVDKVMVGTDEVYSRIIDPLSLNPLAWYDTTDRSKLEESTGIWKIKDSSGNDLYLEQSSESARPTWDASEGCVFWNGGKMRSYAFSPYLTNSDAHFYYVHKVDRRVKSVVINYNIDSTKPYVYFAGQLWVNATDRNSVNSFANTNELCSASFNDVDEDSSDDYYIASHSIHNSGGTISMKASGILQGVRRTSTVVLSNYPSFIRFGIGASSYNPLFGYTRDIFVFNRKLTDSEESKLEDYLKFKHNLQ